VKIDMHAVLVQPLLTEKITGLREKTNTVGFIVHPDANRDRKSVV
jgi:large subunit ribosomal protein L23